MTPVTAPRADSHGQDLDYAVATALLALLGPTTVVDVGAERGSFIALCLAQGPHRIFAFEPLPRHALFLEERFRGDPSVTFVRAALSDRSGVMDLHIAADADGNELDFFHALEPLRGSECFRYASRLPVDVLTLAEAVKAFAIPPIGLLKIDTEGHDLAVIAGLGTERPRAIMAEFWHDTPASGHSPYTLSDLCEALAAKGYSRFFVCRRHGPSEWIDIADARTAPGDWGNACFIADDLWAAVANGPLPRLQADATRRLAAAHGHWFAAAVEKEGIIQGLIQARKPARVLGRLFK
jgi:FkbM family methyltransferase